MKKNRLVQIIKEIAQEKGYSRFVPGGTTNGLTQKTLEQILLNIARQGEDEETYEGDPDRGNKILDKANPENVARILRGEEPKYNEVDRMQELAGIQSEIKVNKPRIFRYKDFAVEEFKKIKEEDGEENHEFYDDLITDIQNASTEDEINDIIFRDFFLDDDEQGMEDFKTDFENYIK